MVGASIGPGGAGEQPKRRRTNAPWESGPEGWCDGRWETVWWNRRGQRHLLASVAAFAKVGDLQWAVAQVEVEVRHHLLQGVDLAPVMDSSFKRPLGGGGKVGRGVWPSKLSKSRGCRARP